MDTIPVELLCAISAQVKAGKKNKRDLASCSLVSQLWRQITLSHLFEKLCVTYTVQDDPKEAYSAGCEGKS